jgi:Spy/CpxP family protein refolding chaperone
MRRLLVPILLVSIGLNLGLLYHQWRSPGDAAKPRASREFRDRERREIEPDRLIDHRMRQMVRTLELAGDQEDRMRHVLERFVPEIVERRRTLTTAHRGLREELAQPDVDVERFRARVHELNEAQSSIDSLVAEAMLEETAVLEPGQRSRYLELSPLGPLGSHGVRLHRGDRAERERPPARGGS